MRLIGASASNPAGQISRQCRRRKWRSFMPPDGGCLRTALRLHRFPRPACAAHLNYPHRHGRWVFVLGASPVSRGAPAIRSATAVEHPASSAPLPPRFSLHNGAGNFFEGSREFGKPSREFSREMLGFRILSSHRGCEHFLGMCLTRMRVTLVSPLLAGMSRSNASAAASLPARRSGTLRKSSPRPPLRGSALI
jgi:hypothetical protein